jgi:hypothetical protein
MPCDASAAPKRYVAVPDVTWNELLPHVRAQVVPTLEGDEFHLTICADRIDRADPLAEFAFVLAFETLRERRGFGESVEREAEAFRRRLPTMSPDSRAHYREIVYKELEANPKFIGPLQAELAHAKAAGKLRCWPCERDAAFRPAGLLP